MKKLCLMLSCLTGYAGANQDLTHKITVTFSFETAPRTAQEWDDIQSHFSSFFTVMRTAEQGEESQVAPAELLQQLGNAIEAVPAYCIEHDIAGSCRIGFDVSTSEDNN